MQFQTLLENGKIWYFAIGMNSTKHSEFSDITIAFTDTKDYFHFDVNKDLSRFLKLNNLCDPMDTEEIEQVILILRKVQMEMSITISPKSPVKLSILDLNTLSVSLPLQDIKLIFPLSPSQSDLSLKILNEIYTLTLDMANFKTNLLNSFIFEHDEKYQAIIKFVNKLNTKYDNDPFNNQIVKEILDLNGSSMHLNHAKLKSSDIINQASINHQTENEIFSQEESKYWDKLIKKGETIGESIIIPKDIQNQPGNIPISSLLCPTKQKNND